MKFVILTVCVLILLMQSVKALVYDNKNGETSVHYGYKTENGQYRTEDIKYDTEPVIEKDSKEQKPVEYRGGYSFVSADGYEYTVLYKANKKGFQPYVTARKIKSE
ncbi:endocuticle structural protein SgAbd-6 [Teleopsis dalmanni]|uniref:endocuticle structural protein SgAbd-6-like n=1 Tax=Teleopsis dalmanni TaxID=139649 RepID=UPI0018CDC869|nr:endocuticle structural protein SgAbd-6-like [Teleopsis dalmanni]XP_037939004.1 endocuticle structural protein SgAbd-6 [Teleopsis dalmanni]